MVPAAVRAAVLMLGATASHADDGSSMVQAVNAAGGSSILRTSRRSKFLDVTQDVEQAARHSEGDERPYERVRVRDRGDLVTRTLGRGGGQRQDQGMHCQHLRGHDRG